MIYLTFIKSKRGILFNNHCFPVTISFLLDLNSKTLQSLLAGTLNESTARSLFCNDARNEKTETEKKLKKRTITKVLSQSGTVFPWPDRKGYRV